MSIIIFSYGEGRCDVKDYHGGADQLCAQAYPRYFPKDVVSGMSYYMSNGTWQGDCEYKPDINLNKSWLPKLPNDGYWKYLGCVEEKQTGGSIWWQCFASK